MNYDLLLTGLWLVALLFYYRMGRRHGYSDGYADGAVDGSKLLLDLLTAKSTSNGSNDEKPHG